jgi:hypothetical protein
MADPTLSDRIALAACPRQRSGATPCPAPCIDCLAIAKAVAHEIADWLRERHGGSSTTADLLDGVGCHQLDAEPLALKLTEGLGPTRQTLQALDFPLGMTVAELKAMVRDWPETDEYGEPCEVWLSDSKGLSNPVIAATPLNMRRSEDGSKVWADFMLKHRARYR